MIEGVTTRPPTGPPEPLPTKAAVARTIHAFAEAIAEAYTSDVEWTRRLQSGDRGALPELLARVCEEMGLTPSQYRAAIDRDSDLARLERDVLGEIFFGTHDAALRVAGLRDALSRMPASGRPEVTHSGREAGSTRRPGR
jgi:hypothetical protein